MKKVLSVIMVLVLVLGLAACGGSKKGTPEAAVDTLMAGIKAFDVKKIQSVMSGEISEDDLGITEDTEVFFNQIKQWASNITYKLGKSEVDGDKATVSVDITYTDASDLMKEAFSEYFTQAMTKAFSNENVADEEMSKLFMDIISEKSKTIKTGTDSVSLDLKLVKENGEWKITDMPEEMGDVILSNITKAFEGMFDGMFGD